MQLLTTYANVKRFIKTSRKNSELPILIGTLPTLSSTLIVVNPSPTSNLYAIQKHNIFGPMDCITS